MEERTEFKPILGLADGPLERLVPRTTVYDQPEPDPLIELTVIIPARNEEACLGDCLQSLVSQSEEIFQLGKDWEIVVVDDHSADQTAAIAGKFPGGNLRRGIHEAERHKAGVLSYSPRQIVTGFAQRSLMPLVFCELALAYPPAKVSDPAQRIAAANGQFLLVEREAYRRLGGHAAVSDRVLEDVELAFLAKRRKIGLRFRYAEDALATRMYRSTGAMIEGWTKNLALLFNNSLALAAWRLLDFLLLFGLPILCVELWNARFAAHSLQWLGAGWILALLWLRTVVRFYNRVAKSNFPFVDCLIAPLGLPLFVALLYRSWFQHKIFKRVTWKGREYTGS